MVRKVTKVPERNQTRILASKQIRTFHNRPDSRPDPRGSKRILKRSETAVITDYLDNPNVPLDDKGKPWQDITEATGVELPNTLHYKPLGHRTVCTQTIQQSYKRDEGIINTVCKEEKLLSRERCDERLD